ncbi:LCP family protein [Streptacidiphilus sp. EB103A]|uniref:LCP family protein n=1 Tax=Streptacidiphilus sp. EB103A TaxID=3156275 RepID=UPI00351193E5
MPMPIQLPADDEAQPQDPDDPADPHDGAHPHDQVRRGRHGKRARRARRSVRVLRWTSGVLGVSLVVGAGAGYAYYQHLNKNIQHGALNTSTVTVAKPKANAAGQSAINILILGTDSRATAADCKLGGSCGDSGYGHADVEMLLHVSADRSNATVLSIPRDTKVDIPACKDSTGTKSYAASYDIITDSMEHGGAGCTVGTWEKLTGISIDHYITVDFSGVVQMADAVGGVPVCTKENVVDSAGSHLKLKAGTTTIKGVQALEWLRTRHAFEDGTDIGRTHAQHLYLNSLIRKLKSANTIANPLKVDALAEAATKALTVSNEIASIAKLASLAVDINKVPTKNITMTTMPFSYITSDPAHVQPTSEAYKLFSMIRNDTSLTSTSVSKTASASVAASASAAGQAAASASASASAAAAAVDKSKVKIAVRNGGTVVGRGTAITKYLNGKGFTEAGVDTTNVTATATTLTYPSGQKAKAQAVASALGLQAAELKSSGSATSLTLVIGTDWTSGTNYAKTLPKAGTVPSTTVSQNAADSSQCMTVNPAKNSYGKYIYIW